MKWCQEKRQQPFTSDGWLCICEFLWMTLIIWCACLLFIILSYLPSEDTSLNESKENKTQALHFKPDENILKFTPTFFKICFTNKLCMIHTCPKYLQEGECSSLRDIHDDVTQLQLYLPWLPDLQFTQKAFRELWEHRTGLLQGSLLRRVRNINHINNWMMLEYLNWKGQSKNTTWQKNVVSWWKMRKSHS